MRNKKNNCKTIKTKLRTNLELLQSEIFGLSLNSWTIEKNAAIIENNLVLTLNCELFDEDVFIQFRFLVQNLKDLSFRLKNSIVIPDLSWFDIAIKYLLIKTETK